MVRLGSEEQGEYDAIVIGAFGNGGSTADKGRKFERLLLGAEQAHRWWAARTLDECRRQGLISKGRRDYQRLNEMPVSHDGEVLSMPKALSVRARNDKSGKACHQLRLIEYWSWDEVIVKAQSIGRTIKGYEATLHGLLRLLAIKEKFPDTKGPAQACKLAGTTIEAVVLGEVAA